MNPDLSLPLSRKASWDEANRSIDHLLSHHDAKAGQLKKAALEIYHLFDSIFALLDALCVNACPFCPDPCCLKATVWFDLKDMLFLHLNGISIPDAQPMSRRGAVCRYLGPRGCRLDRYARPFICTWYLCPVQMSLLKKKNEKPTFMAAMDLIKSKRNEIEDEFVRITASGEGNKEAVPSLRFRVESKNM